MKRPTQMLNELIDTKINCLDHGYVRLVDLMPNEGRADRAVAQAARQSYDNDDSITSTTEYLRSVGDDKRLISYLIAHGHGSPFEMVEFKFQLRVPEIVFRHLIRYRIAEWNVQSGRFAPYGDEFYCPPGDGWGIQDTKNKQGGAGFLPLIDGYDLSVKLRDHQMQCYDKYEAALSRGVAREQARLFLASLGVYSNVLLKLNARSLMHLVDQRTGADAQGETRVYGFAFKHFLELVLPWTAAAMDAHGKRSV